MRLACLLVCASAAAWGQLNGPTLGFAPDGARVRPMNGLVGASALGDPLNLGRDLSRIAASPSGNYVIATAADDGQALLIVNGVATPMNGVSDGAMGISVSPLGSAAAFWFSSGHFQIVSGLPSAPSVRDVDASFLPGQPVAFAVSDDGQALAASWSSGAWLFDPSGAAPMQVADRIDALAFFPSQHTILAATAQGVLSIDSGVSMVLYNGSRRSPGRRPLSPLFTGAPTGIAASFDGQRVVAADRAGQVLNLNLADGTSSLVRCDCAPDGVFGLGGAAFRLTSASAGDVKVFDASTDSISIVPPKLVSPAPASQSGAAVSVGNLSPLPAVTIGGIPAATGYQQQPPMTVSIASPYSVDITGTVTLAFQSSVGGDDQLIQFTSGGRTASFTIPAGSTQASFSGKSTLPFVTGTVAGTITLTFDFTASGTDITPNPPPTKAYTTNPTVPFVSQVTLEQTPGGVTVVVTGFSSTRDVSSSTFTFAPATGKSISNPTLTVPLSSAFTTWYSNTASNAFGSEFKLTVPFPVQGQAGNIVAVTVTLTNGQGASTQVSQ